MITSSRIKNLAAACGFDLCGITTPEIIPNARERYRRWLENGCHGEMEHLAREPERRTDPSRLMEGVQTIIVLGLYYYQPSQSDGQEGCGRVSCYARGKDYHKVFEKKMKSLIGVIENEIGPDKPSRFRWFVDYSPMTERPYAEKAGLGFIGKNGLLINREFGSWILLAEILTDLVLEPDEHNPKSHGHCGACRLCLEACPTGAIISPRKIDARLCISYLTIERPARISEELASKMDSWVFGCDICQNVCPYNAAATPSKHREFQADQGVGEFLNLQEVVRMDSREEFLALTAGTGLTRPKLEGLRRNAEIVLKNQRKKI